MNTVIRPDLGFFEKHRDKLDFSGANGCWLWTAGKFRFGHGKVRSGGKHRIASRVAWEAVHGSIPPGSCVRHKCDTPSCCNPAHLELGTHADNMRDMVERGRQVGHKGTAHGMSKLTEVGVLAIRAEYVRGCREFSQYSLARKHGVTPSVIGKILRREIWRHV